MRIGLNIGICMYVPTWHTRRTTVLKTQLLKRKSNKRDMSDLKFTLPEQNRTSQSSFQRWRFYFTRNFYEIFTEMSCIYNN
jgi:hypothetical protein